MECTLLLHEDTTLIPGSLEQSTQAHNTGAASLVHASTTPVQIIGVRSGLLLLNMILRYIGIAIQADSPESGRQPQRHMRHNGWIFRQLGASN
jgi:hypothetical protein